MVGSHGVESEGSKKCENHHTFSVGRSSGNISQEAESDYHKQYLVSFLYFLRLHPPARLFAIGDMPSLCVNLKQTTKLQELVLTDVTRRFIIGIAPALAANISITSLTLSSKSEVLFHLLLVMYFVLYVVERSFM